MSEKSVEGQIDDFQLESTPNEAKSEEDKDESSSDTSRIGIAPNSEDDPNLNYLLRKIEPIQQPDPGDDLVIFSTRNHPHFNYVYPLFASALLKHDIPSYFFFRHKQIAKVFPDLRVDGVQLTNSLKMLQYPFLYRSGQIGYPQYDWHVDLENNDIHANGLEDVNFYHVILATLRNDRRRYDIDFSKPENAMAVQRAIFTADELLRYCELLLRRARKFDLRITIAGWENEYIPNGIFWMLADSEMAGDNLEYMKVGTLYAHYFGESFGDYFSVTNMTRRNAYNPFLGFESEFQKFREEIVSNDERRKEVEEEIETDLKENILLNPSREHLMELDEREGLKQTIDEYHENGRQVLTLFGHKFYDVGLYDDSDAFDDMEDWIDTTIDVFKDRGDLLIIKPHPSEDVNMDHKPPPNQTMADYVQDRIQDEENIILLDPRAVGSIALYFEIDCGLVWRSSVGLEMACLGLPVIVSGRARYRNYVDLPYTRSKKHFRDQIDGAAEIEITPEAQTSASIYLHFEKTQRHIPIPYVQNVDYNEFRPSELRWNRQAVDDFLEDGDQHLESRIVSEVNYEKGENSEFPFNR